MKMLENYSVVQSSRRMVTMYVLILFNHQSPIEMCSM